MGLLTLGEYLFGWDLGLDQLLFRDPTPRRGSRRAEWRPPPRRVFTFLGLALLLIREATTPLSVAQGLALAVTLSGCLRWLATSTAPSPSIRSAQLPVAVNTAFVARHPRSGSSLRSAGPGADGPGSERQRRWRPGAPSVAHNGWCSAAAGLARACRRADRSLRQHRQAGADRDVEHRCLNRPDPLELPVAAAQ